MFSLVHVFVFLPRFFGLGVVGLLAWFSLVLLVLVFAFVLLFYVRVCVTTLILASVYQFPFRVCVQL